MAELVKSLNKVELQPTGELVQLKRFDGKTVSLVDPEGHKIEIITTDDGTRLLKTTDDTGKNIAIEERSNGTKVYHVASDSTGLPSSHEIRSDKTELVYFYDSKGKLQHFVEIKTNGDRISTVLCDNGSLYSIEQRQIGGIVFKAWFREEQPKEGMVWLHPDGEISKHGDENVVQTLCKKFSRFLDGIQ